MGGRLKVADQFLTVAAKWRSDVRQFRIRNSTTVDAAVAIVVANVASRQRDSAGASVCVVETRSGLRVGVGVGVRFVGIGD